MIYQIGLVAIVLFAAFCFTGSARAQKKIIHAGHLIDGIADQSKTQMSIIIEDGRITSIDKGFTRALRVSKGMPALRSRLPKV